MEYKLYVEPARGRTDRKARSGDPVADGYSLQLRRRLIRLAKQVKQRTRAAEVGDALEHQYQHAPARAGAVAGAGTAQCVAPEA